MVQNVIVLVELLKKGYCASLRDDGSWAIRSWVPGVAAFSNIKLVIAFCKHLENLETVPVQFHSDGRQPLPFHAYIEAAEILESRCRDYPDFFAEEHLAYLKRLKIALLYRLEKENGGWNPGCYSLEMSKKLIQFARTWKQSQGIFWNQDLIKHDEAVLTQVSRYPVFCGLLLDQGSLREEFFSWTLRDGLGIQPFVLFPAHYKKIVQVKLNHRIGAVGGCALKVHKLPYRGGQHKVLTLPFEGRDTPILDQTRSIAMKGGRYITIQEAFDAFGNKYKEIGDIEYFADGVYNWHGHLPGYVEGSSGKLRHLDLQSPSWWEEIPVFKRLSVAEAQERYGLGMDGRHWCVSAKSAREIPMMTYEKTHAYLEVTIPHKSGYHVYNFGKIAFNCPYTRWGEISTFAATVLATISYPDENSYYTHRQHAGCFFIIDPEIGKKMMQGIAKDMQLSRKNRVVFQIESENCGRWIQELLERFLGKKNVPNIYKVSLVEAKPIGFAKIFWFLARLFPKKYQGRALALIHSIFAPWRGKWIVDEQGRKVKKCLTQSSFWKDGIVYLPSYLHEQCRAKQKHMSSITNLERRAALVSHKNLEFYRDNI